MKTFCIDIDGTLTIDHMKTGTYHLATPNNEMIFKVNDLWSKGHKIILFTSRGMYACNGDVKLIEKNYRELTEKWLWENKVNYDQLIFGKPTYDHIIDDKSLTFEQFLDL